MSFKNPNSVKDLFIHLGIVVGIGIAILLIVFYAWLPSTTNHGETITVPDIQGLPLEELDGFLKSRNLRYEVTPDSSYSPDYPPLAVLRQVPAPNSMVKENRKIYVILNAENPPKVRMPKVEDMSLKYAQMVLKSYELKLGEVEYVPDVFFGVVHEARMNGRVVLEGEQIEKGSAIDLVAGDGYGNTLFQSPNLIGLDLEEAKVAVIGSGLRVGKISYVDAAEAKIIARDTLTADYRLVSPGTIQNQRPKPQVRVQIGDPIELWVYQPDSLGSNSSTILDIP